MGLFCLERSERKMSRILIDLPYLASTNKYPKFFPYPLLLLRIKQQEDELLDYNLRCRGMPDRKIREKLDELIVSVSNDNRDVVVGCGHYPADADKFTYFDYFLSRVGRSVAITGVYPAVMPDRMVRLHSKHSVLPTAWDIGDVDIPISMLHRYPKVGKHLRATVRATHGCPRKCGMCPVWLIYRKQFEFWPIDKTVDRIKRYYDQGVRYITFIDDNLSVSPKFDRLLEALLAADLRGMSYLCQEGFEVTSFHRERMCELLQQVRFVDMKMAVENVNTDVLKQIDKYYTDFEVVEKSLANIEKYGLKVGIFFLLGLEHSDEGVLKNIRFIADRSLDVRVNIARPYEGNVIVGKGIDPQRFKTYSSLAYAASWYARELGINIMKPDAIAQLIDKGYLVQINDAAGTALISGRVDFWQMTSRFIRGLKWIFGIYFGSECRVKSDNTKEAVIVTACRQRQCGFGF